VKNLRKKEAPAGAVPAGDSARVRDAPRWRAWSLQVVLVAAVALVLYLALASWSDLGQVAKVMRGFPPRAATVVGGLVALGLALRALRWHLYTRMLALGIPAAPSLLAFVAGFAFTATPGKAGEIVKSFLLRRRFGARVAHTAGTLVVERVTDLVAVLLLALAGLGQGIGSRWLFGGCALAIGAATAFLASERLQDAVLGLAAPVPGLGRIAARLPALLDSSRLLLEPGRLALGVALAAAAWSCEALALDVVLDALGAEVPRAGAFFAFAAATLLGVLSMLPGGLGGFEASMVLILGELDVEASTAVGATLLFRLGTLWAVSLLGLVGLGLWAAIYGGRAARPGEPVRLNRGPG
jgi:uncharacterized membrane protein YbhN (UPF0104 family)